MGVLSAYVSVHHMHAWCSQGSEEGVESATGAATDGSEPSHGCWELNLDPLKEQPVLVTAKPFL